MSGEAQSSCQVLESCLSGFIPVVYSLIYMHVIIEVLMGDAVNPTHLGDTGGTDGAAKGKGSKDTTISNFSLKKFGEKL